MKVVIMIPLIISLILSLGVWTACEYGAVIHPVWSIFWAALTFIACNLAFGLLMKRRIGAINNDIQGILTEGQQRVNRRLANAQQKLQGNAKAIQKLLEKEQSQSLRDALAITGRFEKYYPWNIMLKKQVATIRMQLNYQLKDFAKVDEYLPRCMFMDPLTAAMKLARMHKNDSPDMDEFAAKMLKKFKGENAVLLYGLYSWILVKRNRIDEAVPLLAQGGEKTDNEILKRNWENLANNRVKRFSNAGLGEQWYALHLETPKMQRQKQRQPRF